MNMNQVKQIFKYGPDQLGYGACKSAWTPDSNLVAVCGDNKIIRIMDRQGKPVLEFPSNQTPRIDNLVWDKDNDSLAILTSTSVISIWSMGQKKFQDVELASNKDIACFISWSKTHPVLVVGTEKGNLLFFNRKSQRKIPCISKHGKKVTYGDWNHDGNLITCSLDRILTISNHQGDTPYESFIHKQEISNVRWNPFKEDNRDMMACIINQNKLFTFVPKNQEHKFMEFTEKEEGKITMFEWIAADKIMLAQTSGRCSVVSLNAASFGKKLIVLKPFMSPIEQIAFNDGLKKVAVASMGTIKFYNIGTWQEETADRIEITKSSGAITQLHWTKDGSIVSVTTAAGYFLGFLTVVPQLYSAYKSYCALLSSLTEVSVVDCARNNMIIGKTELEIEPHHLNIGPDHLAVGINDAVWYYRWRPIGAIDITSQSMIQLVCKRDYMGVVKKVVMNDQWAAALTEGQVFLHQIEDDVEQMRKFPHNKQQEVAIVNVAMAGDFLLMIDAQGKLKYYLINDNATILDHRPDNPIVNVFPNQSGTKCICMDNTGNGYLFNPVDDSMLFVPNFSGTTHTVLWDIDEPNLLVTVDNEKMQTYLFNHLSLDGAQLIHLPEWLKLEEVNTNKAGIVTYLDRDLKPLILKNGFVYSHAISDGITGQYLQTHSSISSWRGDQETDEGHLRYFLQCLALNKYQNCINVAKACSKLQIQFFEVLGKHCLKNLELVFAETAFQMCKNVGMVYSIQGIKHETEKLVLMGHVASILFKHDLAQESFMKSSKQELALEMRMDLQDWFQALKLAKQIAPEKEQFICRKLAAQVENQGNTIEAQKLYEKALLTQKISDDEKINVEQHNTQCYGGIARTAIKMGDIQRGFSIAQNINEKNIVIEIAGVCENMKQWQEAAKLYQKGGLVEKAASIYIQMKMFSAAAPLMDQITSPSILIMVAKAKEQEKNYKEAEAAFERANDWENIIRLNLNHLNNPEKAKHIFRTKSQLPQCAQMIANYCETQGAKREAIEFLVLAGKREEAFVIAQSHQEMDEYAAIILKIDDKNAEEHLKIAQFYEGKAQWGKAAQHYEKSEDYQKALKLYISEGEGKIPAMIEMVSRVKIESLTHELVDYLMGETDNIPKEPQWTFKLYRAIGNVKQAVKIAINISQQEQEVGNYKMAHNILLDTYKDIKMHNLKIPFDLNYKLMNFHSFQLAKRLVKMGNHMGAARMLIRVSNNISQFPSTKVNILTTTVAECTQAGLKQAAYQFACILVRPEYLNDVNPKFKKKVEATARKPVKVEDDPEPLSACPFCQFQIPETQLECPQCKNNLPFCIASGKHMTLSDWTNCPHCKMCANFSDFKRVLEASPECPMCEAHVPPMSIKISDDPQADFKALVTLMKDPTETKEEGEENGGDLDSDDEELLK